MLLVHANAVSRAALAGLLQANRYAVAGFSTSAEGLRYLANEPLPCLILYILTGVDDGSMEFRAAQMADPSFAAVPIIMCTAQEVGGGPRHRSFIDALLALVGRHCDHVPYAN